LQDPNDTGETEDDAESLAQVAHVSNIALDIDRGSSG
jgi:hypothetical protein